MIDFFCIFTTTGLVLWSKTFCEVVGQPVNKLIKNVLLAERTNERQFFDGQYVLKWSLNNDLGVVFVVVYQRVLQLPYIDDLLASVKRTFTATFEGQFPLSGLYSFALVLRNSTHFDFDDQFTQILDAAEDVSSRSKKPAAVVE